MKYSKIAILIVAVFLLSARTNQSLIIVDFKMMEVNCSKELVLLEAGTKSCKWTLNGIAYEGSQTLAIEPSTYELVIEGNWDYEHAQYHVQITRSGDKYFLLKTRDTHCE